MTAHIRTAERYARLCAEAFKAEMDAMPDPDAIRDYDRRLQAKLKRNDLWRAYNDAYGLVEKAMRYR